MVLSVIVLSPNEKSDDDEEEEEDIVSAVFAGFKEGNDSGVSTTGRLPLRRVSMIVTRVA
jgi:hypothetical protein